MVMTRSRLHEVSYWQAITEYIGKKDFNPGTDPVQALVAFSGAVLDPGAPTVEYLEAPLNGFGEVELPKKFAGDEFRVLNCGREVPAGFEQPISAHHVCGKRLDSVKVEQTPSRLNRTHPGKTDTFVLDFANDAETIQDVFRPLLHRNHGHPERPEHAVHLAATHPRHQRDQP